MEPPMPTYEYRCNACKLEFEYVQPMADPDLVKCEECGEDKLERLISWPAFKMSEKLSDKALYQPNPKEALRSMVDKHERPKEPPKKEHKTPRVHPETEARKAGSTSG
jgi:putative FmdB family regulatory protein